ncbi:Protein of unknown function [Pseudomonas syringae]|uniref:DUF3742 family protein n=1 Tax=Pseudomonas petroselini TaxID=2899822 RepID=A0ABS8QQL1_9PSED|nr:MULTISPECIES: DUF3742 family protein [Pseudomonas]MCD7037821.1 DUF3742 family protein [Pseudomonas petroselini]MCD7046992.1 DUF3742 family protein [Pseudomonas petroselini]MCD7067814.1 DUF3742 family protein [Pseudomonas petroselini]MCD7080131.1 DUF3742 family protein [Pseudomonas petroselini]MCM2380807.1 DUF3742 family protein [Pseudomonas marginalis]
MPTQTPVQNSRAHRWAYTCGMSIKRGYRNLKSFESRVAERAVTAGLPAGKLLVRGSFLIAKLAIIGGLLFVSVWMVTFIVMVLSVTTLLWLRVFLGADQQEKNPGPDYLGADLYIGEFDDNGHYIGDSKSSN